jgi:hypothetical protein
MVLGHDRHYPSTLFEVDFRCRRLFHKPSRLDGRTFSIVNQPVSAKPYADSTTLRRTTVLS